ncbi:hypothetical protein Y1Q_0020319 [Alligator mississippiensis]|uniref:Uncharacterized protein n=1 Tax=Alligator mississippiensis TaxID=8496 RepID=A0A151NBU3_ALLMI|nr:hypothetical protein Y1Q_0020319 [Alligator mississippiensis]
MYVLPPQCARAEYPSFFSSPKECYQPRGLGLNSRSWGAGPEVIPSNAGSGSGPAELKCMLGIEGSVVAAVHAGYGGPSSTRQCQ